MMLPSQSQRVWMLLAVLAGLPGWWWLAGRLEPRDGLGGWLLAEALQGGTGSVVGSGVAVVVLGLPAVLGAAVVAGRGSALTGAWCVACCGLVAGAGLGGGHRDTGGLGGLGGVMRRADEAGRLELLYPAMAVEVVVWFGLLSVGLGLVDVLGGVVKRRLPARWTSRHLGGSLRLWGVSRAGLAAAAVVAAIGAGLEQLTVVNAEAGQVAGGLILSFALAGLVGQTLFPNDRPWAMLMAPGLVAALGYGWAAWHYAGTGGGGVMLEALYSRRLPGLAAGLPVHHVTAGVLGVVTGVGIGQVLDRARVEAR